MQQVRLVWRKTKETKNFLQSKDLLYLPKDQPVLLIIYQKEGPFLVENFFQLEPKINR